MRRKHSGLEYICAFVLPVAVMLLIYCMMGIAPFGKKSVLAIDLYNQYIHYFSYLKEIIKGNHGFFYSFSKTIGGDMAGFSAYYLMSPFNLLLMPFPRDLLPYGIELITLLKLGLCGLTFSLFLRSRGAGRESLIFSTGYALMSYNMAYQLDIMWLDVIVLFPLVIWGIHRIFERKSPFFYLTALFFSILFNYYIGYMVCIFSALYFLSLFFLGEKRKKFWDPGILGNYLTASFLAGGLAMAMLLPVLRSLKGGKSSFDLSALTMRQTLHLKNLPVKLFIGSFDYDQISGGLPNLYCGLVCLLFAGIFFLCRSVSWRKKLRTGLLLVILCVSFYFNAFNLIWHGFNPPIWFPYRYSFTFCFLVLSAGWEGFHAAKTCSRKQLTVMAGFVLLLMTAAAVWMNARKFVFMSEIQYVGNLLVLLAAGVITVLCAKKRQRLGTLLLLLLCAGELCANGVVIFGRIRLRDNAVYQEFVRRTEPAVQYVKELDDSFYRMEKMFFLTRNDPMLFDYRGLSHYSSTEKQAVKHFMGQMGFRDRGIWAQYNRGSTCAADSLLGVKYILSENENDVVPYPLLDTVGDIHIYRNPYALPLGFCTDEAVLHWDMEDPHMFELQNRLWASMCPEIGQDIFVEEEADPVRLKNAAQSEDNPCTYVTVDPDKRAYVIYMFTASSDDPVFAYFDTDEMRRVQVSVNGEDRGVYFHVDQYDIIRLGSFEKGQKVKVKLRLLKDYVNITNAWFYHQDMDVFEQYFARLNDEGFEIEAYSDARLAGSVDNHSGTQRLLFTIPYEEGWQVFLDGKRADTEAGAGIFLTTQIPEGLHRVELRYVPPGLKEGLALSAGSLVLLLMWIFVRKRLLAEGKLQEIF